MKLLISILLSLFLLTPIAQAQVYCTTTEQVKNVMEETHQEVVAIGINEAGQLTMIYSKDNKFTIVLVGTDGMSCIIFRGEGFYFNLPDSLGVSQ